MQSGQECPVCDGLGYSMQQTRADECRKCQGDGLVARGPIRPSDAGSLDEITREAHSQPSAEGFKTCPDCAEEVRSAARKCRFCGYLFEPADKPGERDV